MWLVCIHNLAHLPLLDIINFKEEVPVSHSCERDFFFFRKPVQ